ncbi:MAG: hypothetical protein WBV61_07655 [Rhodanobacteraceae bacterium]
MQQLSVSNALATIHEAMEGWVASGDFEKAVGDLADLVHQTCALRYATASRLATNRND